MALLFLLSLLPAVALLYTVHTRRVPRTQKELSGCVVVSPTDDV